MTRLKKIVSGGQRGSDTAALDVAIKLRIDHGGWCPRGRLREDRNGKGEEIIPDRYQLKCPTDADSEEKESNIYNERTKLNIRDSDGTLIFVPMIPLPSAINDGTRLTIDEAKAKEKPYLIINLSKEWDANSVVQWIDENNIQTLNVAGPRESRSPGIYNSSLKFLEKTLPLLVSNNNSNTNEQNSNKRRSCWSFICGR